MARMIPANPRASKCSPIRIKNSLIGIFSQINSPISRVTMNPIHTKIPIIRPSTAVDALARLTSTASTRAIAKCPITPTMIHCLAGFKSFPVSTAYAVPNTLGKYHSRPVTICTIPAIRTAHRLILCNASKIVMFYLH